MDDLEQNDNEEEQEEETPEWSKSKKSIMKMVPNEKAKNKEKKTESE